jgi:hypothetical protein
MEVVGGEGLLINVWSGGGPLVRTLGQQVGRAAFESRISGSAPLPLGSTSHRASPTPMWLFATETNSFVERWNFAGGWESASGVKR